MAVARILWIHAGLPLDLPSPARPWENLCQTPGVALNTLKHKAFDAIILYFPMAHWTPQELLDQVRQAAPATPVLIRDPGAGLADAVRLAHHGADGMLSSDLHDASLILEAIAERAHVTSAAEPLLVGGSPEIQRVCHIIRLVGARRATVLITGETGTGKELAARSLHQAGPRGQGPWVAVNCSALPGNLLEAELFGYVRGAFTGAVQTRIGRFEQAHGGTLLLDEIGELPLDLQTKLLRVLQEREFQRLGSSETIRTDIRVVAATNCGLLQRIEQGRFREDLYYRLNVVPLHMPALRERAGDIPLLAAHFVEKVCRMEQLPLKTILPCAIDHLVAYCWPGNVRQLENAVEMAVALSADRRELSASDFPLAQPLRGPAPSDLPLVPVPDCGFDYERTLATIERNILEQALRKTGGNKKAAAALLGLKRTTLSAKVRSLEAFAA